jgi:hypothetical protein
MQARFMHRIVWLALLASSGCELVADFDRSQIPTDRPDTGVTPPPRDAGDDDDDDDAGTDASAADASDEDAG